MAIGLVAIAEALIAQRYLSTLLTLELDALYRANFARYTLCVVNNVL